MKVLVTGGVGYIGSHTCIELIDAGFEICVVDNLCNSKLEALRRVEKITGQAISFYHDDVTDKEALRRIFAEQKNIGAVIHFAGLKAVGESSQIPIEYYRVNVGSTLSLCEVMDEFNVNHLVFSSSATVYGDPCTVPIKENFATQPTNPYGHSKLMVEDILQDWAKVPNSQARVALLRYFNPIGAHESGTIGEDPNGIPNNLLPYISQVAVGKLDKLNVFGDDYDTVDGTGVRDYIHVVDLAKGHVAAIRYLAQSESGSYTWNLGTGNGYSVLQVLHAFEQASGRKVPYALSPRRIGDIAQCYADPNVAREQLQWEAVFDIERMVEDAWRWQSSNPRGYEG